MRLVFFYGLNVVRFLSVVGLLLVFASSIFVMVSDVRAVNEFEAAGSNADSGNCDYIECVSLCLIHCGKHADFRII